MAQAQASVEEAAEELARRANELRIGSVQVREATPRFDQDAEGTLAVFLDLVLADPSTDQLTWPVDDILGLHEAVDSLAREVRLTLPWHVTLRSESPPEPEDEESDES